MSLHAPLALRGKAEILSGQFDRWFPVPRLLTPPSAGIDISDASIKWLSLQWHRDRLCLGAYGEMPLKDGIVENGFVHDIDALASALREVRERLGGMFCAHAALPEEPAYVFSMEVPTGTSRSHVLKMIEFEFEGRIPIPPSAAVYDYSVIASPYPTENEEIGVSVFPRESTEAYAEAFRRAGITLLSLEIEARSIARAVSSCTKDEPITLLVDFGRERSGFAVLKQGIPIFTSTVDVGGSNIERGLKEKIGMTEEAIERYKNDYGLLSVGGSRSAELDIVMVTASALSDEIARHYHYWDTRRNDRGERVTPVGRVILVGGNANLKGLDDYIAGRVHAPTSLGDVWRHVTAFEDYVPSIDKNISMQYATAIGLALRAV